MFHLCTCKTGSHLPTHREVLCLCRGESVQLICPGFSMHSIHYCRNITLISSLELDFFLHKEKELIMPFYWESRLIPVTFDKLPIHLPISVQFTISSTLNQIPQISEIYTKSSWPHFRDLLSLTHAPAEHYLSHTKHCFSGTVQSFLTLWWGHWLHCPHGGCSLYPTTLKIHQWSKHQLWPGTDKCCSVFKKPASSLQYPINH